MVVGGTNFISNDTSRHSQSRHVLASVPFARPGALSRLSRRSIPPLTRSRWIGIAGLRSRRNDFSSYAWETGSAIGSTKEFSFMVVRCAKSRRSKPEGDHRWHCRAFRKLVKSQLNLQKLRSTSLTLRRFSPDSLIPLGPLCLLTIQSDPAACHIL